MGAVLSRTEMKNISGGGCHICAIPGPGLDPDSGGCGTAVLDLDEASALVNELNNSGHNYTYFKACAEA